MPGLLDQPLRGEGGPANTSDVGRARDDSTTSDVGPASDEEQPNVTPEEQREYTQFVENGARILDDPEATSTFLETIKGDGSPVEGLANALVMLVMRLEDSAAEEGQPISGDVLMHGGTELLGHMVQLAEAAGVHKFTDKEQESALYLAMDTYRNNRQQAGGLPEEQLSQDYQEMMEADAKGELETMFPGIGEKAKGMPKPDKSPKRGK